MDSTHITHTARQISFIPDGDVDLRSWFLHLSEELCVPYTQQKLTSD